MLAAVGGGKFNKLMRRHKTPLPHYGQILTARKTIIRHIRDIASAVSNNTVLLIAMGEDTPDYHLRLYSVCARLYYLSKLVYRSKNGIEKLSAEKYEEELFEGSAETKEEVTIILQRYNNSLKCSVEITDRLIDYTYHCLQLVKVLWCTFIACSGEQAFIHEFAYAFEYVIKNRGDLPMPEYHSSAFFPDNYKDFHYTEGIADDFAEIMESFY